MTPPPAQYGAAGKAAPHGHCPHTVDHIKSHVHGKRNELPNFALIGTTVCPVLVFILVNWVRSCEVRYSDNNLSLGIAVVLLILVCIGTIPTALNGKSEKVRRCFGFMCFSGILAFGLGFFFGGFNFQTYFKPYFDITNLNIYPNTDPRMYHGQQFLDAAVIEFSNGTKLGLKAGFGFKNGHTYCVAPIVSQFSDVGDGGEFHNYDFWAVGKDCCSGHTSEFECGEYNNPKARRGLRLLNDADRNYYRLAVEGACAQSSITAQYPLFFHWMEHPEKEIHAMVADGWSYYWRETITYLLFQVTLTVIALIACI